MKRKNSTNSYTKVLTIISGFIANYNFNRQVNQMKKMINSIGILKKLTFVAFPVFIIHVLLFNVNLINGKESDFYYSIPQLYGLFFMLSSVILITVTKISEKNFNNTGMVFMIATSIKMAVAFFLVKPILHLEGNKIEKNNFFIIFILFLLIETILVAKILNKK